MRNALLPTVRYSSVFRWW